MPESVAVSVSSSEALPRSIVPSKKVTVPVAVPAPGALADTVAVSVTGCPAYCGLGEAVRRVVVASWFTTWVNTGEVPGASLASPP